MDPVLEAERVSGQGRDSAVEAAPRGRPSAARMSVSWTMRSFTRTVPTNGGKVAGIGVSPRNNGSTSVIAVRHSATSGHVPEPPFLDLARRHGIAHPLDLAVAPLFENVKRELPVSA